MYRLLHTLIFSTCICILHLYVRVTYHKYRISSLFLHFSFSILCSQCWLIYQLFLHFFFIFLVPHSLWIRKDLISLASFVCIDIFLPPSPAPRKKKGSEPRLLFFFFSSIVLFVLFRILPYFLRKDTHHRYA